MSTFFTTNDPGEPDDDWEMPPYLDERRLVTDIRSRFPAESALTDQCLSKRGCDPWEIDDPWTWISAFADRTGELVIARDAQGVQEHTQFFAEQFQAGTDAVREIIDVSYVENMMWKAQTADKVWAWEFIVEEIRQIYAQIWRVPGT
jgi:hypothetical protein